ncbi:hypothetical protein [Pedobacter sp. SYP-B3415]|uniref:VPS10 domain-containing protein n=1 Tax=Pedobacter sp. SYP-B3415 TaxID=2496641 RepID=UPI00101B6CCF|nr:hypothetical protein [Pedobacter sp. SYP-B3415]
MRLIIYLIILSSVVKPCLGQDPYLGRLSISGLVGEPGVSPRGDIWLATATGKVYYRSEGDQLWRENPISSGDFEASRHYERISFFADSTMMLSGFLQADGKTDFIFRTKDYGKTWEKVPFGKDSWLDGAYVGKDGKAWMTGSSQYIYYTNDSGKTWQTFDKIEKTGNLRITSVYFRDDGKTGLFGSLWNTLYLTTDNCSSWTKIPTPLTQKRYTRVSTKNRPDIRKIRINDDYYIIDQEGKTFVSKTSEINWEYLPEVQNFEVTSSGNLYTLCRDGRIKLYDSNFSCIWTSEKKVRFPVYASTVKGNELILLTAEELYQISPSDFRASELLRADSKIPKPELQISMNGQEYGFAGRDVLKYDATRQQWYRLMVLDFHVTNATSVNGKLLISDDSYNQFYELDPLKNAVSATHLPPNMIDLKTTPVIEFRLERDNTGCYHHDKSIRSFVRKGNRFILDTQASGGTFLNNLATSIEESEIHALAKLITETKPDQLSLQDLNITHQDISNFKQYIDKQAIKIRKKGLDDYRIGETVYTFLAENTDFEYYKQVADSLYGIPHALIGTVFSQEDSYWSTTTVRRSVTFVFKDGKKLVVENAYNRPNYLLLPWDVDYGKYKLKSNAIGFSKALNRLTKGGFFDTDIRDKRYAIFRIAEYLYGKKLIR